MTPQPPIPSGVCHPQPASVQLSKKLVIASAGVGCGESVEAGMGEKMDRVAMRVEKRIFESGC